MGVAPLRVRELKRTVAAWTCPLGTVAPLRVRELKRGVRPLAAEGRSPVAPLRVRELKPLDLAFERVEAGRRTLTGA